MKRFASAHHTYLFMRWCLDTAITEVVKVCGEKNGGWNFTLIWMCRQVTCGKFPFAFCVQSFYLSLYL